MNGIVGTNAENRSVAEVRGRADRGKTRTGRVVQFDVADTRVFGQMAALPDTHWRATSDYEVAATSSPEAIEKTADIAGQDAFRIKPCAYQATHKTFALVENTLKFLEENRKKHEDDVVLYCVAVVKEIDRLISKHQLNDPASDDYKFMIFQLGPFYVNNLHPALELIKSKADEGCGWEYYMEIILIGKYLDLRADELSANTNLVRSIYRQILDGEMLFLKHIKDHPVDYAVRESDACCKSLLEAGRTQKFKFLQSEEVSDIDKEKQRLMRIIEKNLKKNGDEINIDQLREDVHRGTAHKPDKRLYLYVLQDQCSKLDNLYFPGNGKSCNPEEYFSCIKKLLNLHVECASFLSEFHSLFRSIKTELTSVTKLMLKNACADGVRLEEKMMKLILDMIADKMVSPGCLTLCLYCKELEFLPESAMRMAVRNDKITDDQCYKQLSEIKLLLAEGRNTSASRDHYLQAAYMLRQLLYNHLHEIKTLPKAEQHLQRIDKLKIQIKGKLFSPVLKLYCKLKDRSGTITISGDSRVEWMKLARKMSHYRCTLAQLVPYKFVLTRLRVLESMSKLASFVWFDAVSELADKATSFREEDVDCLLALKHLSPFVPNRFLRPVLEKTLSKFFQIAALPDGVDGIPDEKILLLSQWIHDMDIVRTVTEHLKANHEFWKKSYGYAANGRDMTSSKSDMPLTSTQESNNFQEVPRPVVLTRKTNRVTVSVINCRSITGDNLIPSGSKKTPSQEEILTMPEALPSTTSPSTINVASPESRADFKKDKMCASRFCEELEQLAHDTANHEMVTEQASPATPWLRGADQLSLKAGERVLRATAMVPVGMMEANEKMEIQKLDMSVASRSVPEAQGWVVQWAQTGRSGQRDAAAVPEFHPMAAVASDTFQQMGNDDEMAVQDALETTGEVVSDEESGVIEIEGCPYESSDELRQAIEISLRTLAEKQQISGMDHLTFCLIAIRAFKRAKNVCKINNFQSQDHKLLVFQFGPYYADSLRPALEILKDKADAQYIWEHYKDLTNIADHFFLQLDEWPDKSANKELLKQIYQLTINNELDYLDFLKDFPLREFVDYSPHTLSRLFDWRKRQPKYSDLELLSPETVNQLKCKMGKLMSKACTSRAVVDQSDHNNDAIDEDIAEVEKDLRSGTAGVLHQRLYDQLLRIKILKLKNRLGTEKEDRENVQKNFIVLKQLCEIYNKYITFVPKGNIVCHNVAAMMSRVTKEILKFSLSNCAQLEKNILDLISVLLDRRLLNKECTKLYLYCKELHVSMRATVQPVKMTRHQYMQEINEIKSLLDAETDTSSLTAAKKLKQLLFFNGMDVSAIGAVNNLRKVLRETCFLPIFKDISNYKKMMEGHFCFEKYDAFLHEFQLKVVTINPYVFTINNLKYRLNFLNMVCPAWRFDLERIAEARSLEENDIDRLLELKRVVPDVGDARIRNYLTKAFDNCLSLMVNECSGISVEKVVMLAEWCRELDCLYSMSRHQQCIAPERNGPVPVPEETL